MSWNYYFFVQQNFPIIFLQELRVSVYIAEEIKITNIYNYKVSSTDLFEVIILMENLPKKILQQLVI